MEQHKEKALENVAGLFDNAWKIGTVIIIVLGAFASCVLAWNQIFDNETTVKEVNKSRKKDRESVYIHIEKEFNIRDQRSDKRYKRALNVATELKDIIKHQDAEIEELKEGQAYQKGRFEMYLEMHK